MNLIPSMPHLNSTLLSPLSLLRSYGSRAVDQLRRYYEGQVTDVVSEGEEEEGGEEASRGANGGASGPGGAAQGEWMAACL
jgi:hypothetical protein